MISYDSLVPSDFYPDDERKREFVIDKVTNGEDRLFRIRNSSNVYLIATKTELYGLSRELPKFLDWLNKYPG